MSISIPAAIVLSVVVAQGKVPPDSSWNSALPLLTLECLLSELVEVLKDMILQTLWAYNVSAPSILPPEADTDDLSDLMGAVKERRMEGGIAALSGVEGAEASAIMLTQGFELVSKLDDGGSACCNGDQLKAKYILND